LCHSGTDGASASAIAMEGFKIGGKDIPARHGSSYGIGSSLHHECRAIASQ
jgi:hypothetical protein